jgi:hypothetical protein
MRPGERYQVRVLAKDLAGHVGTSPVVVTPPDADGIDSGSNRPFAEEPMPGGGGVGGVPADGSRVIDTNKPQIKLTPQIEVGRSGVGKIHLWVTRDQGRTWEGPQTEENPTPLAVEGATPNDNPRTQIKRFEVTYDTKGEDGLYGFIIVAENSVQMSYPGPQRGDPPDILVQVDTKAPQVSGLKTNVQPAGDSGNRVTIEWNIQEDHLARGGITLLYSPVNEQGMAAPDQWNPVATDLDNTGRYDWMVGPDQPYKFKLKLVAVDRAGNSGEAVTEQPVTVDLFKPRTIQIDIK